ncbi:MAG: hypothetical protein CMO11_00785 [Thaumarchaeota archaeon]|nr:hypothetical protein [Nitrososphaerota archaeon]
MLINLEQVIKYFFQIFLINTAIAIIVAIPVLIPSLAFPILITEWPGIYMIIGFFFSNNLRNTWILWMDNNLFFNIKNL